MLAFAPEAIVEIFERVQAGRVHGEN